MMYRRFDELLKSHGVTVYRVAKETGIPASTFTDWKNGRSIPKMDKIRRIADFFGISIEELIGERSSTSGEFAGYTSLKERKIPVLPHQTGWRLKSSVVFPSPAPSCSSNTMASASIFWTRPVTRIFPRIPIVP